MRKKSKGSHVRADKRGSGQAKREALSLRQMMRQSAQGPQITRWRERNAKKMHSIDIFIRSEDLVGD